MSDRTTTSAHPSELWSLLSGMCDGLLTAPERDRLEAILTADVGAKRICTAYLDQHAQLLWRYRDAQAEPSGGPVASTAPQDASIPPATDSTAPPERSPLLGFLTIDWPWTGPSPRVLGIALAGLLLGYFVVMFALIPLARQAGLSRAPQGPGAADREAERRTIGKLTPGPTARWASAQATPANGVRIGERCKLSTGRATLRLSRGTCLVIEGPAEWKFQSTDRLQFDEGRLAAHVPPAGVGFAVVTPCAEVVDLGTDFGIEVEQNGKTEVHVVRGKVAVRQVGDGHPGPQAPVVVEHGRAIRVSAAEGTEDVSFDAARFSADLEIAAASPHDEGEKDSLRVSTIWLGNLFDDRPGTPLAEAMRTDTYKATPTFNNTLGVCTLIYGGEAQREIAPGIAFDLACLDWGGRFTFLLANDAWTDRNFKEPSGGLRLSGQQMPYIGPKIEDGIGTYANSVITFDLDELRAAGKMPGARFEFVCESAGINDGAINTRGMGSVHLAAIVSTAAELRLALVDGKSTAVSKTEKGWRIDAPLGKPLLPGGPYVSFRAALGAADKYLTLICSSTADGEAYDHGTWIGARLQVVP